MSVSVLERVNPCWVEKADEPTGSVTKTLGGSVSAPASPSHHLGDNGAETKAHLLFSLGAPLLLCGARFCPRRSHSAFPYQPRLGFLCCCCGAFSLAVAASKINILLMLAGEIHCLKAATCFATEQKARSSSSARGAPRPVLCE
jgi:hypothetical protein